MSDSTADRFIRVMAMISAIDPDINEPMHHLMITLKHAAEMTISNAIQEAERLAWSARQAAKDCKSAIEDDRAAHIKATQGGKEGA